VREGGRLAWWFGGHRPPLQRGDSGCNRMAMAHFPCYGFFMNKVMLCLGLLLPVSGCSRPEVKGNGTIKTEDRTIADFSAVGIDVSCEVHWSKGKSALTVSTDENLLPLLKTEVSDGTLRIYSDDALAPTKGLKLTLSSPDLSTARLNGGIKFSARPISADRFKLSASGASDLVLEGSAADLDARLTGASHLNAKSLQTRTAALSLIGASDAHVAVSDNLKVSITGAGSLIYSGNPAIEQHVLGRGRIEHAGLFR
jgi:hypothetical protein